jgi:small-conductance mechanosensitive channel/CRP-like cAMP-binding protein
MKSKRLRRQLLVYLVLTALCAAAWWITGRLAMNADAANVVKLCLALLLALVGVRIVSALVFGAVARLAEYRAPALVRNIFAIIVYLIAFVFIFKWFYPNAELTALFATSTIFGLILGLALQDTLGNLFAGISLQADKPFQIGDVITVSGKIGVVESVTWRGVRLRTFANQIVFVSNSSIAKEPIEVAPRDNLNARLVFFNTLYTDSPAKTIHVVREAIREAENVSRQRRPIVRIRALASDGIDWEVKYWLEDYAKFNDTDALVRQLIWYAFRRANINFAFPTRTLYLERPKKEAPHHHSRMVERLAAVDIFAPLSEGETERLARAARSHVFAPGESVIRAGEPGSSMFVLHKGRVRVQINDNGKPRTVATLNEGDFFGEMALLTGEPRTANVVAAEETEVMEIGHDALKELFDDNPDLMESLCEIVTERRAGLVAQSEDADAIKEESAGLLNNIRRFFGFL